MIRIFKNFHFFETRSVDPKIYNHAWLCNDFPKTKGFHKEQQRKWPVINVFSS